jgi:chromosomal replication initiator protein
VIENVWQQFLSIANQEIGSRAVETWFKAIQLYEWDKTSNTAYLYAPNQFIRDWICNQYQNALELHLSRLLCVPKITVVISVQLYSHTPSLESVAHTSINSPSLIPAKKCPIQNNSIKKQYIFDSFIVDPHNEFAFCAAQAIIKNPGTLYNPLFLCGNSGVGKTHLLHAIGNAFLSNYKSKKVLCFTIERFMTEFVQAIRSNTMQKFHQKYQEADILLVDDIQDLAHKEQTQDAFFHIFNNFHDLHKQIVFSCDAYPNNLPGITQKLRSRLGSGLIADLLTPTLETKMNILKQKAVSNHHIALADDIAYVLADMPSKNIRDLEGILIRVIAFSSLTKEPLSISLVQKALNNQINASPSNYHCIIETIAQMHSISYNELCGKNRNKELTYVRHIAMYLIKKYLQKSLREIGSLFGHRDHATVKYAIEKITTSLSFNKQLQYDVLRIENMLSSRSWQ